MILPVSLVVLVLMFVSVWIFFYSEGTWMKLLSFSSLSIKGALFILLWGSYSVNTFATVVALAILILGDLSVMLLAIFLERRSS